MRLHLNWTRPIPLKKSRQNLIYDVDLERLPASTGIYIFGRQRKDENRNFEALYVGQATRIRNRVRHHLENNLRLMLHLKNAKQGQRVVLAATFRGLPGQQAKKSLAIVERALIRHFLSEGHNLVNKQGTQLRHHEIVSDGKQPKRFIPKLMYLDR